jgi:hypothetical protein
MTDQMIPEEASGAAALPARQLTRARTWTGDTEWYTPPTILEAARGVLGAIDLDPASSDAQQVMSPVKATRYHTVDDSGLDMPWRGRVWLNPPYARGRIDRFVGKMVWSYQTGDMVAGILLTNSATETSGGGWRRGLATPYVSPPAASGFLNCATARFRLGARPPRIRTRCFTSAPIRQPSPRSLPASA